VVTSSERKPLGGSSVWLPQRAAAVLQVVEQRVGLVRATLLSQNDARQKNSGSRQMPTVSGLHKGAL
jgi:hypothetical protein